jgi:serine/threonine protein kinase
MSNNPTTCDPSAVRHYLDRQLSAEAETALEAHLDTCTVCQGLLNDSAAEGAWWNEASQFLSADKWDGPVSQTYLTTVAPGDNDEAVPDGATLLKRLSPWLDATDDPNMLGRFGGYEIAGVIGEGGMGIVLKGHEPSLNRYVAIKMLAPHLASNGAARQRFSREAQAAAAVLHENVIAIHRVDESQGLPYLVMPYIGGVSLQKRIDQEGPLPVPAILRIARQIAAGLAAAHAQGLVHRDVKPANILLERGVDRVTLTDFGLARAVDDATLTRSGVIAGTPQYMAPEQARGEAIDGRSDLFSLGSVMYAMCTGRAPFRAETPFGILRRISDDEPRPIREINPMIPEWLETIVRKLHAKLPGDRYQSPGALAELLEHCLAHVQQPTRVPLPEIPEVVVAQQEETSRSDAARETRRRWRAVALSLVGFALVAAIALHNWKQHDANKRAGSATDNSSLEIAAGGNSQNDGSSADGTSQASAPTSASAAANVELWDDGVNGLLDQIGPALEEMTEDLDTDQLPETE